MRFAFDEQQLEFRAGLRAFADKECPPTALRKSWESETGWSSERWRALAEMGVTSVTVPEAFGGLGLGAVDLVLLLEEVGRSGLPEPLLETAVGAHLLVQTRESNEAAVDELLGAVVQGTVAIAVPAPEQPNLIAAGTAVALVWHQDALVALPEAAPPTGGAVRTVDGTRHLAALDEAFGWGWQLAAGAEAEALRVDAFDRGALAAAAVLAGVGDRMIAMAAEYAGQRVQFGKPIGSFQAVKHRLADALVRVEFAKPLVYRAAWSLDHGDPEAGQHCSMAKAAASDAATLAARAALQVHGAIGYTWEHDLHLWMKRAWSLASLWGDAGWHRARLLGLVDW